MLDTLLTFVTNHPELVASLVGSAGVLSLTLESILLKLKRSRFHIDSKKLATTLLHVFALATTAATYVIANLSTEKAAGVYSALTIGAELWHRFAISPLYGRIVIPFLDWLASRKSENKDATGQTNTVTPTQTPDQVASEPAADHFLGSD